MRQSTKIKRAKEQVHLFNKASRKCPICNNGFKSDECTHSHEEAREFLFNEYTKAVLGITNNK